ncbi:bile acid:sodium symporter family protein [Novosphingobium resinovorum]|uniref:bile acid:sodium symporter family protein n=1 Tax=Novosphingobium TaxID=165696 RepID=UPI001B3C79D0|nr:MULTISPECIES: bile acid:sodium symporter family protein [Novosphingobium]MBF7014303.1 bile acid:sodium symporter [Novosphingobium sp. HR1a]WJM25215.1 bile acid:sodium symporter family protein [Novosphingobium resinovorum]
MKGYLRAAFDAFLFALVGTVCLASFLPVRGAGTSVVDMAADAAIVLLFFLQGAKLSREALLSGAGAWKLHLAVLGSTFVLFPLLGLGIERLGVLDPVMASGLLFLTLLPSTVQSSIAFTSVARGNVAAAVCSASFSNLLGIALTPILASVLMRVEGGGGLLGMSWGGVRTIALQLLLPFVAGHLLRPWIGPWVARHRPLVMVSDRGSILLVVYSAFSAAIVEGLWHRVAPEALAQLALWCVILLALVLLSTWVLGRLLGLERADAIVLQFCGSKKSLVSGVPLAGILFPASQVGAAVLPLMLFHQIQLFACAILARHYADREEEPLARRGTVV